MTRTSTLALISSVLLIFSTAVIITQLKEEMNALASDLSSSRNTESCSDTGSKIHARDSCVNDDLAVATQAHVSESVQAVMKQKNKEGRKEK